MASKKRRKKRGQVKERRKKRPPRAKNRRTVVRKKKKGSGAGRTARSVKSRKKKGAAKKLPQKKSGTTGIQATRVGAVSHYFPRVHAAAVIIKKERLRIGDAVYIKGHTTDFKQTITSMQLDRVPIKEGKKGQEIGLLVKSRTRIGDSVYKL